jgi:hypothetical protein
MVWVTHTHTTLSLTTILAATLTVIIELQGLGHLQEVITELLLTNLHVAEVASPARITHTNGISLSLFETKPSLATAALAFFILRALY